LPAFLRDKLGFLTRCAQRYGEVVALKIGEPTYLLTNPEDIRHVLMTNADNYNKTRRLTSPRGQQRSGRGMHTSSGDPHLRRRRLLQPLFFPRSVERFCGIMVERTDDAILRWRSGGQIDLSDEMELLTLSVILDTLFGTGFADREPAFVQAIVDRRAYLEYAYSSIVPWVELLPLPIVRRYRRAQRRIDQVLFREIAARRFAVPEQPDFATLLLAARDAEGAGMSDQEVRDELLTLCGTGYETVGDALSWTLYLLDLHSEAEERLQEELQTVLRGKPPDLEAVPQLRYTRQVLDESMRLYPPTWIYVRMAVQDDQLPSGVHVRQGEKLYLCQYVMHRHPQYYSDPDRFEPSRFETAASQLRPQFAYFPFGAGPRTCIGQHFALLELVVVLARLQQRCRFRVLPGQNIRPQPAITLRPADGIRVEPQLLVELG
jgi:cytochrome P450